MTFDPVSDTQMIDASWLCTGGRRPHAAALVHFEHLHAYRDSSFDVHRCQTCGTFYWCAESEVSDWGSGGGDYSEVMRRWLPLEEDEFDAARSNSQFRPRSTLEHRDSSGWRREG